MSVSERVQSPDLEVVGYIGLKVCDVNSGNHTAATRHLSEGGELFFRLVPTPAQPLESQQ